MTEELNSIETATLVRTLARLKERILELESLLYGRPYDVAHILDAAITNAKFSDVSADKLTAGEFTVTIDIGNPSAGFVRIDGANNRIVINDGTTNRVLLSPTTFRISLSGVDCLVSTDPREYSIFADQDNILIKEKERGSSDVATDPSINHGLGYIPFYLIMGRVSADRYRVVNAYNQQSGVWLNYCDTSNVYLDDGASSHDDYNYYIFYDDFS